MNWFSRTLTRKFTFLLAGFLALQAFQLGIGIFGILHVGEESAAINEAGRQRMHIYKLLFLTHEALESSSWPSEGRAIMGDVIAAYDAECRRLHALVVKMVDNDFRDAVATVCSHWESELKRRLLAFDPSDPGPSLTTLALFEAHVPTHVRYLDEVVGWLERDINEDTRRLAVFQAIALGLTLLLGATGFVMAHYIVTLPLRRLTESAHAIAAGAYDRRVAVASSDELGELAGTFNLMAQAIGEKTSRIAALNDVAIRITSMQSLRDLMDEIMRQGMQLTGAQAAGIAFYNQATVRFDEWITQGLSSQFIKNIRFLPAGVAEMTFESGRPLQSDDRLRTEHRLDPLFQQEGIRSFVCLPLTSHANRLGVICFFRKDLDCFQPDEIEILTTFSHLAAGAIENARLQEKTLNLAVTDKLTGLRNRRYFDQRLVEEIHHAAQQETPLSLLMLDIDDFKRVNDVHGHVAGDRVLQALSHALSGQLWQVDIAARYGGEEFAVILPQTDFSAARKVAERIRDNVAKLSVSLPEGGQLGITVSIGVACYPRCGETAESLVEHADQALYTAKREGKNRICLYREILKAQLEQNPDGIVDLLNRSLGNIQPIVTAVSSKTAYYHDHASLVDRVAELATRALNLSKEDRETLYLAAQLHDIGMISVPDAVLRKHETLTGEDWELIRRHPAIAAGFLEKVPALRRIVPIVRHHHERYDGKGYPDGLKGDDIPYLARVLAAVDAYASMMGEWEGHKALSPVEAGVRLSEAAGNQLDPQIVPVLIQALDAEHLAANGTASA